MVLIKSCVILIGIRVKEQTAELVDINCLDLPVGQSLIVLFGSEFCVCADLSVWHRRYRTEYLPI